MRDIKKLLDAINTIYGSPAKIIASSWGSIVSHCEVTDDGATEDHRDLIAKIVAAVIRIADEDEAARAKKDAASDANNVIAPPVAK